MQDAVEQMMNQWRAVRPDLDPAPMGVFGRIARLNRLLERENRRYFEGHGLDAAEFDMLATLARAGGRDGAMSAGALLRASMVTSGAITNRLDKLERRGLVARAPDPRDRRSVQVSLTSEGHELIHRIIEGHFAVERRVLAGLEAPEVLAEELRRLLVALGDTSLD